MGSGRLKRLFKWLVDAGCTVSPKLQVRSSKTGGRGIFATEDIEEGELVLLLHPDVILTGDAALQEAPELRGIQDHPLLAHPTLGVAPSAKIVLAAFCMLKWADPASTRFAPYFKAMGKHRLSEKPMTSTLPFFWSDEELSELSGTLALHEFQRQFRVLEQDFLIVSESLRSAGGQEAGTHTLADYRLAYIFVAQRTFTYNGPALLPLADVANHYLPAPDHRLNEEEGRQYSREMSSSGVIPGEVRYFGMKAVRSVRKGGEYLHNYGLHNNSVDLFRYGFVTPWIHNSTCETSTRLRLAVGHLPERLDAHLWRQHLLEVVGPDISADVSSCFGDGLLRLHEFARFWSTSASGEALKEQCGFEGPQNKQTTRNNHRTNNNTENILDLRKAGSDPLPRLPSACALVSLEEELASSQLIRRAVKDALSAMPGGSLQEDEDRLESLRPGSRLHCAVTLRRDEKYVLSQVERHLADAESKLRGSLKKGKGPRTTTTTTTTTTTKTTATTSKAYTRRSTASTKVGKQLEL
ncbi:unnamed protein product [Polarella glacialis]|uniref:SET domain-containing protein n=1 Tax=Polarella glacialis TaxID=89957 RepID=A0A813ELG4_POLGL|nr:unnamed protein product [Polarella glacialis]